MTQRYAKYNVSINKFMCLYLNIFPSIQGIRVAHLQMVTYIHVHYTQVTFSSHGTNVSLDFYKE